MTRPLTASHVDSTVGVVSKCSLGALVCSGRSAKVQSVAEHGRVRAVPSNDPAGGRRRRARLLWGQKRIGCRTRSRVRCQVRANSVHRRPQSSARSTP